MRRKLFVCFALTIFPTAGTAASVYVDSAAVDGSSAYFGVIDLTTGAFTRIGQNAPSEGLFGLVGENNGTLVAMTYASNLERFDPGTGVTSLIGPTGLASCVVPTPACTSNTGSTIGGLPGAIYGTDFANNFYRIDSGSGHATLIGSTGIPAIPYVPGTQNADGSFNFFDQSIFSAEGKLYTTFDAFIFDTNTGAPGSVQVGPALYVIDPVTGHGTRVGSTDLGIGAVADVDGTLYAFNDLDLGIYRLDTATGNTQFTGVSFDPAAGVVQGAWVATPEPGSLTAVGVMLLLSFIAYRRHRRPVTTEL